VANEAYRAVFLRVHPTGKMVLSLTTEADGNEAQCAQLVAHELGVPPLDVKVVPADTDRFGTGHGFNTAPSPGQAAAITRATDKIKDKAKLLAGVSLGAAPDTLTWRNGAWVSGDGSDPDLYASFSSRNPSADDFEVCAIDTGAAEVTVHNTSDAPRTQPTTRSSVKRTSDRTRA